MEFLTSGEFGRAFFALGTVVVLGILWFGYYRDVFVSWLALSVSGILIGYMTLFLGYRYFTEHITMHMSHQPYYALLASIHGTISLAAIILACVMFVRAAPQYAQMRNYFQAHPALTLTLAVLWPLAFLSGLLI